MENGYDPKTEKLETLTITVDGQPFTAPHTFASVVGFQRPLGAPLSQSLNDTLYSFSQWSDLGPATHTISTPASNTTYAATYQPLPIATLVGGDRQAFALDGQGVLWRIKDGVYANAGFGGLEIAVSNVGGKRTSGEALIIMMAAARPGCFPPPRPSPC